MKKLKIVFLLSISIFVSGFSNTPPTIQEDGAVFFQKPHADKEMTRYVWATTLRLREKPSFDSKVITGIPFGASVKVYAQTQMKKATVKVLDGDNSFVKNANYNVKKQIGDHTTFYYGNTKKKGTNPSFYMDDFWVKIKYKNFVGYVFNGYLSRLNAIAPCEECSKKPEHYIQNLIDLNSDKIKLDSVSYSGRGSVQFASFNNGNIVYFKNETSDQESIKFKGYSYNEVVLVALKIYDASLFEGRSSNELLLKKVNSSEKVKIVKQGDYVVVSDYK